MKRIKAIGHLLFSFRGRILREKWLVAVVVVVGFNVWQANELLELKKQVRLHKSLIKQPKEAKGIVYILEGVKHRYYHRDYCYSDYQRLGNKKAVAFSEVKGKYDPCKICKPATTEFDAKVDQVMREIEEEEEEFAARVERALRRLREGSPLPRY